MNYTGRPLEFWFWSVKIFGLISIVWFNSVIGFTQRERERERERESFVGNDCSMRFLFRVMLRIKHRHFIYIYKGIVSSDLVGIQNP